MVTEARETAICLHHSETVSTPAGDISTCRVCRQKTLAGIKIDGAGKIVNLTETIIERGYINGVMTEVHPPLKNKENVNMVLIPEADFQEWFRHISLLYGYLFYHTHRAQHSPSGFTDNVLARLEPRPRLIFAELKTDDLEKSQPSPEQYEWLFVLQQFPLPVECYLWRPSDRDDIERILK
jgi:hypothetical protein